MGLEKRWKRELWASLPWLIVKHGCSLRLVRPCPQFHPAGQFETDSKPILGHPLTVNDARKGPQIAHERTDHQSFIQISSPLGQDSYSERADVFRSRPLCSGRVLEVGNLHRDSQPSPFLKSSRP